MDNKQMDDAKSVLSSINDSIAYINNSHEKITFEYERNIRRNFNLMEMDCFSTDDKYFFDEQNQQIYNLREREESDYEEYLESLNKRKRQLEEDIKKAERKDAIREEKECENKNVNEKEEEQTFEKECE